ncbi:MAG: hypothetical protein ACREAG_01820 [Nitrosopumilaceae archaeon]
MDSYKILNGLKDKPEDLVTIKKELGRIQGLLQVLVNKIEESENRSDTFSEFLAVSKSYLKEYSFNHEIQTISDLYSEDPMRVKNLRLTILSSFEESKLLSKIIALLSAIAG